MRTDTVSSLRQRMIEDMNARKLGSHTQRSHILSCKRFAAFLKRSPDTATAEDIRQFQLHLSQTSMSICNRNRIMTGLRFLFRVTLRRLDLAAEIYHIREPQKIPLVMSPDETRRLLAVVDNLKVRTLLGLGYGCGLRAGEVVRLKVKHIDRAQKIIRVEQSKGRKDRNVMLSPETFDLLRQWWKVRPSRHDNNAATGTLAVSRPQGRQADDHPPVKPPVPRGRRRSRDQEEGDAARTAPQLRDPLARARHRYQNHPGAARS
jgi:integrase/recombinase XerD